MFCMRFIFCFKEPTNAANTLVELISIFVLDMSREMLCRGHQAIGDVLDRILRPIIGYFPQWRVLHQVRLNHCCQAKSVFHSSQTSTVKFF